MTRPTPAQLENARAGHAMTVAGAHTVGAPDGGPGLRGTGWSREHGDLRVAHFLGLHAVQIIPLVALFFTRRGWNEARRTRMVWVFSASYLSMFVLLLWQALRGQSVIRPDATTTTALIAWAVMSAFAVSLANWRSDSPRVAAVIS